MSTPQPTEIALHQASRLLEIAFSDGAVRGHGPGQEVLQAGKREVEITAVEPVGSYAVRLVFSDGHDTGLYSWDYLYHLGTNQDRLWQEYLDRLARAGASREPSGAVSERVVRQSGPGASWKKL